MAIDEDLSQELLVRFTYHAPTGDQPSRYEDIHARALSLAEFIAAVCPDSRERSLAWTNLEQCVMWANAAIARHEEGP